MKVLIWIFGLLAIGVAGMCIYARNVSLEAALEFQPHTRHGIGDWPMTGGFEAVRPLDRPMVRMLMAMDKIILSTPRTKRSQSGGAAASYVTRSRFFGFPDVTHVWIDDNALHIRGHLVIGVSDMGVNEARIRGWLDAL